MYTGKKSREVMLGSGLFLIVIGIALLCFIALDINPNMLVAIPIVVMLIGALFLFLSYTRKKLVWMYFLGYFLTSSGLFSLIFCFGTFELSMKNLWPMYVILCGLSYFVAAVQVRKRLSVSAVVPAVVLIVLGGMLLCFSLGIISVSLRYFVAHWWPIFLVLLGFALIIIYAYMQHSNKAEDSDSKVIADSDEDD
ncbi:MAG: DUF5668 domain-containing protein [Treponemataceae bacterium]|jgi:uncharacterized membrane protein HdeD (DUF308 family)|nr:DUF5668 domain-containing protein [Treponemataceae bacterium]